MYKKKKQFAQIVHLINHVCISYVKFFDNLFAFPAVRTVCFSIDSFGLPLFRILFVIYLGFHLGQMMNVRTRIFAYK